VLDGALGAPHCMELPFTFANIGRWGPAPFVQGVPAEVVERVTGALHGAWIGFIRDGRPESDAVPSWRPYTAGDRAILVIGAEAIRTEANIPRPGLCASP
jgi:carboxylesterase type B